MAVGGGGLISGIGCYIKALMPGVRIIGVEPFEADAMYQSLRAGRRITLDHVGIFADGVAVREVGELTFALAQDVVDEVVRVTNDEICAAIKDIFDDTRSVMEPAGALAVAGLKTWAGRASTGALAGQRLAAVLSGANMNFDRLRFVAERAELGEAREALFAVTIPERPGAFREFCATLGRARDHRVQLPPREPQRGPDFRRRQHDIQARRALALSIALNAAGYETLDLSENELAKLHVRHMVGGRASDARHERPCRFEFPERPGALMQFLDALGGRWNISLFHYRNHGADFGRVLAAFEVPDADLAEFHVFLDGLGYPYLPETDNQAYGLFLE